MRPTQQRVGVKGVIHFLVDLNFNLGVAGHEREVTFHAELHHPALADLGRNEMLKSRGEYYGLFFLDTFICRYSDAASPALTRLPSEQ